MAIKDCSSRQCSGPIRWLVATSMAMLVIAGCGRDIEASARYLAAGKVQFEQGNFEKARIELKNAAKRDPNGVEAYFWLGLTFEKLGDPRQAYAHFAKAQQLDPGHLEATIKVGSYHAAAGEFEKALQMAAAIESVQADNIDAKLIRSRVAYGKEQIEEAIAFAEGAVAQAPGHIQASILLSSLYALSGQSAKATALVESALTQAKESIELRSHYVRLLLAGNAVDKALPWLVENVRLDPKNLEHRLLLAWAYVKLGDKDKAEGVTRRAVEEMPDRLEAKFLLIDFLGKIRSAEQAEQAIREYITASPKEPVLRFKLAELQAAGGKLDAAQETYQEILKTVEGKAHIIAAKNAIAILHVRKHEVDRAKAVIDDILREYPDNPTTLLLRGRLALDAGDGVAAVADLRAALKGDFNSVEIRRLLAQAHLLQNQLDLARESLQKAIELNARDVASLNLLAQVLIQKQQFADAQRVLDKALAVDPKSPEVRFNLFRLQIAQGDRKAALQTAEQTQRELPDSPLGFFMAGLLHKLDKDTNKSISELLHAVKLQPGSEMALALLVDTLVGENRYAEAEAHLRKAIQTQPENAFLQNFLGLVRQKRKDFGGAVVAFQSAAAAKPDWWVPYRNVADSYFEAGDERSAMAVYQQALEKLPEQGELLINMAVLQERIGQIDEAIATYERILEKSPDNVPATNNLALLLVNHRADAKNMQRALDLVEKLASVNHPEVWDTRGWILFRAGKPDQALELLGRAANAAPSNGGFQYHLGLVHLARGEIHAARKHLQSAVSLGLDRAAKEHAASELAKLERPLR